ncbi:MAG: helix-turn-helix domain-containing protein, partial [Epulopiscium sp.]|nr:helix-turn-helix domain-containing protein [Candidatus Epulonipiscium sp.]
DFLIEINEINDCKTILKTFLDKFRNYVTIQPVTHYQYKDFIEKTLKYIDKHLSDSNLSLKWIAENYLYMNVDYLSKQFVKQTGYKFSHYLTSKRIEKAKQLLLESSTEKIYIIAEQVGCGNNPQYFSQIFKKYTGITPTEYIKKMDGGKDDEGK